MQLSLDDLLVVETVTVPVKPKKVAKPQPDGWSKKDIEAAQRGAAYVAAVNNAYLRIYLRGRTLEEVIAIWHEVHPNE